MDASLKFRFAKAKRAAAERGDTSELDRLMVKYKDLMVQSLQESGTNNAESLVDALNMVQATKKTKKRRSKKKKKKKKNSENSEKLPTVKTETGERLRITESLFKTR